MRFIVVAFARSLFRQPFFSAAAAAGVDSQLHENNSVAYADELIELAAAVIGRRVREYV